MQKEYELPELQGLPKADEFVILQSEWHADCTNVMIQYCITTLEHYGYTQVRVVKVPGALELPLIAKLEAKRLAGKTAAIIAIGAIIRGETEHFRLVADEVTRGLGKVAYDFEIPVIQEVLAVENKKQLEARSGDNQFNKGIEAALAAVKMLKLV